MFYIYNSIFWPFFPIYSMQVFIYFVVIESQHKFGFSGAVHRVLIRIYWARSRPCPNQFQDVFPKSRGCPICLTLPPCGTHIHVSKIVGSRGVTELNWVCDVWLNSKAATLPECHPHPEHKASCLVSLVLLDTLTQESNYAVALLPRWQKKVTATDWWIVHVRKKREFPRQTVQQSQTWRTGAHQQGWHPVKPPDSEQSDKKMCTRSSTLSSSETIWLLYSRSLKVLCVLLLRAFWDVLQFLVQTLWSSAGGFHDRQNSITPSNFKSSLGNL